MPAYLSMKRCGSAWAKVHASAEGRQAEVLAGLEVRYNHAAAPQQAWKRAQTRSSAVRWCCVS
jgi:hypothetical protein